jgi:PAS domain S-box-containing protein
MARAPLPENELERLKALKAYAVLDTPPEEAFDEIVKVASLVFNAPTALVSLVDAQRQWFKARVGMEPQETSRDVSFCAHAILDHEIMVVEDTTRDERFWDNPLVEGDPPIRFYAGAPLVTPEGFPLGTLCVIDNEPRTVQPSQVQILQALAHRVVAELELRRATATLRAHHEQMRHLFDALGEGVLAVDPSGTVTFLDTTAEGLLGLQEAEAVGRPWEAVLEPSEEDAAAIRTVLAQLDPAPVKVHLVSRQRTVEVRATPVPEDLGAMLLLLSDITQLEAMRRLVGQPEGVPGMVGISSALRDVAERIRRVSPLDIPTLLTGETGTGKEVAARAIHELSPRRAGPFIALNCGALSESILGSQLFGHRRGAFTGAVQDQQGLFEAAGGGTVFLDEIGEMPLPLQSSLLRVLEAKEVVRLGDSMPRAVDFRLISATNRNLRTQVKEGAFREDLYYRIVGFEISLPPLRDRREDVLLLARHFARAAATMVGVEVPQFDEETLARLMDYDWPGNIRELRSVVNFAVLHSQRGLVKTRDLPPELSGGSSPQLPPNRLRSPDPRQAILQALDAAGGNRSEAAKLLGISRATLYRKLEQLGIR